jgi:hypothetical protein
MNKSIGLIITLIAFSVTSLLAQSPSPAASPATSPSVAKPKHKKKAPTTAASPAVSPAPPAVSPTPAKRSWFKSNKPTPAPAASPATTAPMKKTVAPSTSTPAPGAGPGMVWVNTDSHVYHKEGSRWYGKTKKGKYMTEQDAIKEGDHADKEETKKKP